MYQPEGQHETTDTDGRFIERRVCAADLQRDVRRYQKAGGRIQQLASGRARDLCPVGLNDIEQLCGFRCEL